jgi:hypothetical protein
MLETVVERRKGPDVAQRVGITLNTHVSFLGTASRSMRQLLTDDAEVFTDVEHSLWYDVIEELRERDAAAHPRLGSGEKGERSSVEGDRSNFEGDRSNSARDRGKTSRAGAG